MSDTTGTTETQPRTAAETLEIVRAKAKAARLEANAHWAALREAEAEMLPAKKRYENACSIWHIAHERAEMLEGAVKTLEAQ